MTDAGAVAAAYSSTGGAWARGPERVYGALSDALVATSRVAWTGRSVLDVGAGTGAAGRAVVAAGAASVVSVDAAIGMLRHRAACRPPAAVGDACALPFADGAFSGAVAAFSLNHVDRPGNGLRELARVVAPGGPVLASAYAADDTHPVKQATEEALSATGWTSPDWYEVLKREVTPRLATVEACEAAVEVAGLEAEVIPLRIPFADLTPLDLVEWRLGMAHCAPFVDALSPEARDAVVADVLARLGPTPATLVRSVMVIAALSPITP